MVSFAKDNEIPRAWMELMNKIVAAQRRLRAETRDRQRIRLISKTLFRLYDDAQVILVEYLTSNEANDPASRQSLFIQGLVNAVGLSISTIQIATWSARRSGASQQLSDEP